MVSEAATLKDELLLAAVLQIFIRQFNRALWIFQDNSSGFHLWRFMPAKRYRFFCAIFLFSVT